MSDAITPPPIPTQPLTYFTPIQYDVGGIWRDGSILIVHKSATLPDRCIKCNSEAHFKLRRRLSWHPSGYYLLILFPGLLIYIIVYFFVRNTATVNVGLCDVHRRKRNRSILIAWLLVLAAIVTFVLAGMQNMSEPVVVGIILLIAGALWGVIGVPGVSPSRIDKDYAWLKGCGSEFLASLPSTAPQ